MRTHDAEIPYVFQRFVHVWDLSVSLKRGGGGDDGDASEAPRTSVRARWHGVDAGHEPAPCVVSHAGGTRNGRGVR